jgi:type II secretory pathway component PulK
MNKVKFYKKEQGSALMMVIIAFVVITIIATSVFALAGSNTKQVVSQNDGIESYYIARSGAEATYQALLTSSPSLLTQFQSGSTVQTDTITFDEGTAEITVEGFNEGTTRRVRITSVGKATGNNVSRKSILEFNYNGYGDIKWSR